MATALEQILSSASQRIENPIESSMDGISAGFKLAEQQYNNQIKQQEIELKKQEAQANFLSKGISSLSALSKVKNAAQRKLLTGVTLNYLRQGGLEDPNGNIQAFLSDPEAVKTVAESVEKSGEKNKEILLS